MSTSDIQFIPKLKLKREVAESLIALPSHDIDPYRIYHSGAVCCSIYLCQIKEDLKSFSCTDINDSLKDTISALSCFVNVATSDNLLLIESHRIDYLKKMHNLKHLVDDKFIESLFKMVNLCELHKIKPCPNLEFQKLVSMDCDSFLIKLKNAHNFLCKIADKIDQCEKKFDAVFDMINNTH